MKRFEGDENGEKEREGSPFMCFVCLSEEPSS